MVPSNKITHSRKNPAVLFQLIDCSGTFSIYFQDLVDNDAPQHDGVRKTSRAWPADNKGAAPVRRK
jgi:hypothetical protein